MFAIGEIVLWYVPNACIKLITGRVQYSLSQLGHDYVMCWLFLGVSFTIYFCYYIISIVTYTIVANMISLINLSIKISKVKSKWIKFE